MSILLYNLFLLRSLLCLFAAEFRVRSQVHYAMHVQTLSKEEKTKFKESCDETIMEALMKGLDSELRTVSPGRRVDAAAKMLQKTVSVFSNFSDSLVFTQSNTGANDFTH